MRIELQKCISALGYKINALKAPQNASFPYIVHQVISDEKISKLSGGDIDVQNFRYQLDVYSNSYNQAIEISEEVVVALNECESFGAIILQVFDAMDQEGQVYKVVIDFKIWS